MTDSASNADRYRQAKTIAHLVLDQPESARESCLHEHCGADEQLRAEVCWLLAAAEDASADHVPLQLDQISVEAGVLNIHAPLPRDYRLLRRLGEGGMGVVYLAERVDGDLRQQVALKLLRLDAGQNPAIARRFEDERRILSSLSHRNIAHLIDAGISADGRPFLAMEFVDGLRVDLWSQQQATTLKARIELFLKVCDAVEYAHQQLIIHRDIKPANILVGADGEPKLLDFGIARLLDDQAGRERAHTESGLRALTLAYASPEQIEGGALGTATDVYSLGVVLYQLITGQRPFDHLQSAHHLSNAIVSGEITPPSRLLRRRTTQARSSDVTPAPLPADQQATLSAVSRKQSFWQWLLRRRRVPRDVDAIVLKALRHAPGQRYASVAALAADLRRFLGSRPVHARRGHWPYRLRRFAWRWRWALAAACAFAVLLAGFTLERETQLQQTQIERDRAEALAGFMNDLFENADSLRSRGNEVTVRELLDRGAEELLPRVDLERSLRRSMLLAMGRAYNGLGLGRQAVPLLESALALLPEAEHDGYERARLLGHLSQAYSNSWRTADSIAADAEAIELLSAVGDRNLHDDILRLRIRKLHNQANQLDIPLSESRAALHAIVDELEARPEPPDPLLLQVYRSLTVSYSHPDTAAQALAMAEKTLEIAQRHYRIDDPRLLSTRFVHAMVLGQVDPAQAIEPHRRLIADYGRLIGPGMGLAAVHSNLGVSLSMLDRHKESLREFERAAEIIRATGGTDNALYRITLLNIGTHHAEHGDPAQADQLMRETLSLFEHAAQTGGGGDRSHYAQALRILALATQRLGRPEAAETLYVDASNAMVASDEQAQPHVMAGILVGLVDVRVQLDRLDAAATSLDRLEQLNRERSLSSDDPSRLPALVLRAEMLLRQNGPSTIESLLKQARPLACLATSTSPWRQRLDALLNRVDDTPERQPCPAADAPSDAGSVTQAGRP